MERSCRSHRPGVERMEPRALLSTTTAAAAVGRVAARANVLHAAFSIQTSEGTLFSRQSGAATITVARQKRAGAASVEIIAQANSNPTSTSAQPGVQFRPINQTVNFAPGQTTQTVTIPLIPGNDGPEITSLQVQLKPTDGSSLSTFQNLTIVKRADVTDPQVTSARLQIKGSQVVGVAVMFNEDMDPVSIADPRRYVLVDTHKSDVKDWLASLTFKSRNQGNLSFRSGSYNSDTRTLSLTLAKPVKNLGRYQFGAVWAEKKAKYKPPTDISGNPLGRFTIGLNGSGAWARA